MAPDADPIAQLVSFLAVLAGREPRGGQLEIRYRDPGRPARMRQHWHPLGNPTRAAHEILTLGRHTDVYVGVAPRRERRGGRAAVQRAWVLWADIDHDEHVELAALPVAPGIAINSGTPGHQHLYWPLTTPLPASRAEHANRVLAHALAGDRAVTTLAAIMRAPGTLNHKHDPPGRVTLERLQLRAHPLSELLRGLPAPTTKQRGNAPARPPGERAAVDPLQAIAPADYIRALTGREADRDGKLRCPFHDERTPSLHAYPDPQRGWHCFGCGRGGDVYTFASHLWQVPARGADFPRLRERLREQLLVTPHPREHRPGVMDPSQWWM